MTAFIDPNLQKLLFSGVPGAGGKFLPGGDQQTPVWDAGWPI
jgi:hypothetical protein